MSIAKTTFKNFLQIILKKQSIKCYAPIQNIMLAFDQVKVPLMLENDQNGKTSIFDWLIR